jgi:hypothetical protein
MQSYDNILKVVSVAYGKYTNREKTKIAKNQTVMKSRTQQPMEKYMERYGKGENSALNNHKGIKKKMIKKASSLTNMLSARIRGSYMNNAVDNVDVHTLLLVAVYLECIFALATE